MRDENTVRWRAALRACLEHLLLHESDFRAFVLDHFPNIYRRFTDGQDQTTRINFLLEDESHLKTIQHLLEAKFGTRFRQLWAQHRFPGVGDLPLAPPAPLSKPALAPTLEPNQALEPLSELVSQTIPPVGGNSITGNAVPVAASSWRASLGFLALVVIVGGSTAAGLSPEVGSGSPLDDEKSCGVQEFATLEGCWSLEKLADLFPKNDFGPYESRCDPQRAIAIMRNDSTYRLCRTANRLDPLYRLLDLAVWLKPSILSEVIPIYKNRCTVDSDWWACIRVADYYGQRAMQKHKIMVKNDPDQILNCKFLRLGCEVSHGINSSCLPIFLEDGIDTFLRCSVDWDRAPNREIVLRESCELNSAIACYSLGMIHLNKSNQQAALNRDSTHADLPLAVEYLHRACVEAKPSPIYCKLKLGENETDSLNPLCDRERAGIKACKALLVLGESSDGGPKELRTEPVPAAVLDATCRHLRALNVDDIERRCPSSSARRN